MLKLFIPACVTILFISFIAFLSFFMIGKSLFLSVRHRQSKSWPVTNGTILELSPIKSIDGDDCWFAFRVRYSYRVDDCEYENDRIAYRTNPAYNRELVLRLHERLSHDNTIEVRYHPKKPSESCLNCGVPGENMVYFFFGILVFVIMLVVLFCIIVEQTES